MNETPVSGSGPILYADEFELFSEAVANYLPNGSTTYVDREEDCIRNGPDRYHRLHFYMSRMAGTGADRWLADTSAELARDPAVRKWKLHLPEAYDNAHPAPPSPNLGHEVEDDRLNLAVVEVAFDNARRALRDARSRAAISSAIHERMIATARDHSQGNDKLSRVQP